MDLVSSWENMNTQAQYCLTKCAGKDVKERELLCTVDGNVNRYSHKKKKNGMEDLPKTKNRTII